MSDEREIGVLRVECLKFAAKPGLSEWVVGRENVIAR
jgi:hypothetical protein